MSILIRMEMPKDGECVVISSDGTVYKYKPGDVVMYGDAYNETAVAVKLPPHGRLIDGDAIAAYIEKQISERDEIMKLCKRAGDIENYFSLSKIQIGMVLCRRVLDDAPTIIPAEGGGTSE